MFAGLLLFQLDQNQAGIYFKQIKLYLHKVILHGLVQRFVTFAPICNNSAPICNNEV